MSTGQHSDCQGQLHAMELEKYTGISSVFTSTGAKNYRGEDGEFRKRKKEHSWCCLYNYAKQFAELCGDS